MAGPLLLLWVALIVLGVVCGWLFSRRAQSRTSLGSASADGQLALVMRAARQRALTAVSFAVAVFLAGVVAGVMFPALLGMPFAVTPLIAASAGLLLYAATPPRSVEISPDAVRTARLGRRSWRTVIPQGWLHGSVEIAILFVIVVVVCGLTADDDGAGRSRSIRFESADWSSSASPYPGWFYGIPALVALCVLATATGVALHRIGTTAAFPRPEDAGADEQWRRASASVVLTLAAGSVLVSLGGYSLTAGIAMSNATVDGATPVIWDYFADVLKVMGAVALVLSAVSVTLAALTVFTIGDRVRSMEAVRR